MVHSRPVDVVFVHGLFSDVDVWAEFSQLINTDEDLDSVRLHRFGYDSPFVRRGPTRRIPTIDDIADQLALYLEVARREADSLVLVSHSQGGLIVQRYLARTINAERGHQLARIKCIVMYGCPNTGSAFLGSMRKLARFWHNPQERQLRRYQPEVSETQRIVLQAVVHASGVSHTECRIRIEAYGGASDGIVPPASSTGVFSGRVLPGDHSSIVRPADPEALSYQVLKSALLAVATMESETKPDPGEVGAEKLGVSIDPPFGMAEDRQLYGRSDIVASVMSGTGSQVHVLAGMGGSGKSRLALEIARRAQDAGWPVWWVSVVRINSGMRAVAGRLGIPDGEIERAWRVMASAPDLVWRYLNASREPWLLVFDNADDPAELAADGGNVADGTGWLRPHAGRGMVVVTSRDKGAWGNWCQVHPVPPLSADDGGAMLIEYLGLERGTYEQARVLSAELGGLPLALRAAADYIKSSSTQAWSGGPRIQNMADYQIALKRRFEAAAGSAPHDALGLEKVQEEVLGLSLELLAHRGLTAAPPLLKLFACLNIALIPYPVLLADKVLAESSLLAGFAAAGSSPLPGFTAEQRKVLDGLAELGLIELQILESVEDSRLSYVLSLHPVVHGMLRGDKDVRRRRAEYFGLSIQMMLAATEDSNPDYPSSWPVWNLVVPHAVEVAKTTLLGNDRIQDIRVITIALELARLTSRYLIVAGLIGPAMELLDPVIGQCASFGFHEDDKEILGLRHEKGRIALERGDPVAAERQLAPVVAVRQHILEKDHPDTLASMHKLARAILEQGRWAEAEAMLTSIVEAEQYVRGPEHSDTMVVRHSLARAILAQERREEEAEAMLREILKIRYRNWPRTTPETMFVRQTLAMSMLEQNDKRKWQEAEAEISGALSEVADRMDLPVVMLLRHRRAVALLRLGRVPEAAADLARLLTDQERVLGGSHPETERTRELLSQARSILDNPP